MQRQQRSYLQQVQSFECQFTTQLIIWNNYRADFWECLPDAASTTSIFTAGTISKNLPNLLCEITMQLIFFWEYLPDAASVLAASTTRPNTDARRAKFPKSQRLLNLLCEITRGLNFENIYLIQGEHSQHRLQELIWMRAKDNFSKVSDYLIYYVKWLCSWILRISTWYRVSIRSIDCKS